MHDLQKQELESVKGQNKRLRQQLAKNREIVLCLGLLWVLLVICFVLLMLKKG